MTTEYSMASVDAALTSPTLAYSQSAHPNRNSAATSADTSTIHERHDSQLTSSRSSLSSCSNDSIRTNPSAKQSKRVRFEESVCCSYFDVNAGTPSSAPHTQSTLRRKPSFWERLRQRNVSADHIGGMPHDLQALTRRNCSADILVISGKSTSKNPNGEPGYSIHQPLRESSGRRYTRTETRAYWQPNTATTSAKGDWGDLLSNPRASRLVA